MNEELREVRPEDCKLLFEWANEKEVRKNSFSSAEISYEEHKEWFQRLLSREDCKQYIYCVDGIDVGQVRVSINGENAEIGYSICSDKRGYGYGKSMIELLKKRIKEDVPQVQVLVAKVKTENIASHKVFVGLGYEEKYRQYELML